MYQEMPSPKALIDRAEFQYHGKIVALKKLETK
jgi:hypothetical protein